MFSSDVKPRFLKPGKCHIIQNSSITLVLCGFETWFLFLREERRIFASKSEEVIVGYRRLCIEKLHELYSLNIIRAMK